MFLGGHLPELIVLLVVALVIFGPKRLPEIGGAMGKGIREFKKGTSAEDEDTKDGKIYDRDRRAELPTDPEGRDVAHASSPARDRDVS